VTYVQKHCPNLGGDPIKKELERISQEIEQINLLEKNLRR